MSKLTKKSVDDANALPKPYLLWDGELRGFGLLVLPSGVKTYVFQYRNEARRSRRLTIGRHRPLTVGQAREIVREAAVAVAKGNDPVVAVVRRADVRADLQQRDLAGGFLASGFIDEQVNGGGALLNAKPSVENVKTIAQSHWCFGTTGLLPTLTTDTPEIMCAAINAVREARFGNSAILGIHIEGPFLDVVRKGVHAALFIRSITEEEINNLAAADRSFRCQFCPSTGRVECWSHCVYPFVQRDEPDHRTRARYGGRCPCRSDRFMLITDAMSSAAGGPQRFELQGRKVKVTERKLQLDDGTLAGSNLTVDKVVRYAVHTLGVDFAKALRMASFNPARYLKLDHELGRIAPGYRASLVHLDQNLKVLETWVDGT